MAECCRTALEGPFAIGAQQLSGVGSRGTVSYPEQGLTIGDLLRRAAAMYREKARRRPGLGARDPNEPSPVWRKGIGVRRLTLPDNPGEGGRCL